MKLFVDLKSALVRDKIDRALQSLYLEAPRKAAKQHPVGYGVFHKPKANFQATI